MGFKVAMEFDFGDSANSLADFLVYILEENGADDVVKIDTFGKSDMADFMILASGRSEKHVKSLAGHVSDSLEPYYDVRQEGLDLGNWVVVSLNSILVHIFTVSTRLYYDLESLWSS